MLVQTLNPAETDPAWLVIKKVRRPMSKTFRSMVVRRMLNLLFVVIGNPPDTKERANEVPRIIVPEGEVALA
jgi:hypothetical protein